MTRRSTPATADEDPPRRADARRNIAAILAAAGEVLAREPRASMQDIAQAAGVHRATVHRHFPARDDLLTALRVQILEETIRIFEDPAVTGGEPRGALERLTRTMLELGDRSRLWRIAPMYDDSSEERSERLAAPLVGLFERGRAAGVMRDDIDPLSLARAWGGLVVASLPAIAQRRTTTDEATSVICRLLTTSG